MRKTREMDEFEGPSCAWGKGTSNQDERRLLEGPKTRTDEFLRVLRIMTEFIRGFRKFHFIGPCVTVFGSARVAPESPYYELAREMGHKIAGVGLNVITGGGPGIMEAANRGAKEAGGYSIGCNIVLPFEQKPNPYLDRFVEFRYFFVRKVMLVKYSYAFVVLPGGYGTMDEIFEALTLIQTGKIRNFPVILLGKDYWEPLIDFLKNQMLASGFIEEKDLQRFILTDSPDHALHSITECMVQRFGFSWKTEALRKKKLK